MTNRIRKPDDPVATLLMGLVARVPMQATLSAHDIDRLYKLASRREESAPDPQPDPATAKD